MSPVRPLSFAPTHMPGLFHVTAQHFGDERGEFIKLFREDVFRDSGVADRFAEWYVTRSRKDVLRGMHFQVPPVENSKLVFCLFGRVLDVVLDLRVGSPSYGEHSAIELDEKAMVGVYMEAGFAHGYLCLTEGAMVAYATTSLHSAEHDIGVMWDSCGIDWPTEKPLLSEKDRVRPTLAEYDSPFVYVEGGGRMEGMA
jgi:dTDP-4-dehydrorhamnose 3,5-epimerase